MKKNTLLFFLFLGNMVNLFAQSDAKENPRNFGANKFLMSGHTAITAQFDSGTAGFGDAGFSAVFLYKLSDKLFMESELEVGTGSGTVEVGLEHAKLVWMFSKYSAFYAGRWVPKFGMYRGRIGESFINKFATDPAGFGDGGIGAMEETGFGFMGGLPLGPSKLSYDLWVTNGPQLLTDAANAGQFDYEAYSENNKNKAVGGRIGFLPFSNSCLELGLSYEMAQKTGLQYSHAEAVGVQMAAIDMNFFHTIKPLKSTLRISGEYKMQNVDMFDYSIIGDSIDVEDPNSPGSTMKAPLPSFNNSSSCYYGTVSIRPSGSNSQFFRNLELAYRYSQFMRPKDAPWGGSDVTKSSIALDYWLKWNCVAKISFEQTSNETNRVWDQMVYGF